MEDWTSGTGQKLKVHNREDCKGEVCAIHNPTDHHMLDWPQHWRDDRGIMERLCPCGVGHPDPDDYRIRHSLDYAVHGCCGCCSEPKEVGHIDKFRISKGIPKPPIGSIVRDGDTSEKCTLCGSSQSSRRWWWPFKKYCINPECENYIIRQIVKEK